MRRFKWTFLGRFRGGSFYSRTHWQCWVIPQIFLTRGGLGGSDIAIGFRWLFWGGDLEYRGKL